MSKILDTLELIRGELNAYFHNADPRDDDWVILSNLTEPDGRPYHGAQDRVVMFLANITHETSISTFRPTRRTSDETYAVVTPPLYVNLHLLCVANFFGTRYPAGLAAISGTISFFQQNPYFDHHTLPDLDPSIEKLTFEMVNLGPHELHQLMGLAGVRYLPSVYYKLRMIPFDSDAMKSQVPAVTGLRAPGEIEDP